MNLHAVVAIVTLTTITKATPAAGFATPALYKISEPLEHGECPTWDARKNTLYYVDLHIGKIYAYDLKSRRTNSISLNGEVAPVVPSRVDPDLLVVGLNRSIAAVKWDQDVVSHKILSLVDDKPTSTSRLNDGKADKEGRLWFGTTGKDGDKGTPNQGALYKITANATEVMIAPVNISNGMAWNKANDRFFYIDSASREIASYDYDNERGAIANRRVVFDLRNHNLDKIHPDGMTIDTEDNLWVALYGGGSIIKVNPSNGELMEQIPIPAKCVTSVAWGGDKMDILFVTTSRIGLSEDEKLEQPGAGCVYALTGLGKGFPPYEADIVDSIN